MRGIADILGPPRRLSAIRPSLVSERPGPLISINLDTLNRKYRVLGPLATECGWRASSRQAWTSIAFLLWRSPWKITARGFQTTVLRSGYLGGQNVELCGLTKTAVKAGCKWRRRCSSSAHGCGKLRFCFAFRPIEPCLRRFRCHDVSDHNGDDGAHLER